MSLNRCLFKNAVLISFLVSTLIPFKSDAGNRRVYEGIRGVLNGGGYGEMLALTSLQQLPNTLRPFLVAPLSNQLTDSEKHLVDLVLGLDRDSTLQKIKIEFFPDPNNSNAVRYSDEDPFRIGLSHDALYLPSGEPLSYPEISKIVFDALMFWPQLKTRLRDLKVEASDIHKLSDRIRQHASAAINSLNLYSNEVQAHLIQLKSPGNPSSPLLLIELPNQTLNINSKLEQYIDCSHFQLRSVTGLFFEAPFLSGKLRWACGEQISEGSLALGIKANPAGTNGYSISSLNISGVRKSVEQGEVLYSCTDRLK